MSAKKKIRVLTASLQVAFEERKEIKDAISTFEDEYRSPNYIVRSNARARLEELNRELWIIETDINELLKKRRRIEKTSVRMNRIIDHLSKK